MSTPRDPASGHDAVFAYYRAVGPTLLAHLVGRPVTGLGAGPTRRGPSDQPAVGSRAEVTAGLDGSSGPDGPGPGVPLPRGVALHIADAADLDEAVRSGVVSFALPDWTGPHRLALHLRAGEDSGIDIVATAALALMEAMQADGVQVTALLDGAGGMYLAGTGAAHQAAGRYARELADRSPEMATTSVADTAGRALVQPLSPGGDSLPAPYSLVMTPEAMVGTGRSPDATAAPSMAAGEALAVIAPLSDDEVAAATAGMPLEIDMAELVERIPTRGDLARNLAGPAGADA